MVLPCGCWSHWKWQDDLAEEDLSEDLKPYINDKSDQEVCWGQQYKKNMATISKVFAFQKKSMICKREIK